MQSRRHATSSSCRRLNSTFLCLAVLTARLTTSVVVCRREEQYATLQAKLEELRQNSSLLKKKAIIADSSLTELHEVSPQCSTSEVSRWELTFICPDSDHGQGESCTGGRIASDTGGGEACRRRRGNGVFDRGRRGRGRGGQLMRIPSVMGCQVDFRVAHNCNLNRQEISGIAHSPSDHDIGVACFHVLSLGYGADCSQRRTQGFVEGCCTDFVVVCHACSRQDIGCSPFPGTGEDQP